MKWYVDGQRVHTNRIVILLLRKIHVFLLLRISPTAINPIPNIARLAEFAGRMHVCGSFCSWMHSVLRRVAKSDVEGTPKSGSSSLGESSIVFSSGTVVVVMITGELRSDMKSYSVSSNSGTDVERFMTMSVIASKIRHIIRAEEEYVRAYDLDHHEV
jgi:hypothetical protein